VEVGVDGARPSQVLALQLGRVNCEPPREAEAVVMVGHRRGPGQAPGRSSRGVEMSHIEYELPHPQVLLAVGLVTVNPRLFRSSWKSTTAPLR